MQEIWQFLNPSRFRSSSEGASNPREDINRISEANFDYASRPLLQEISVKKQQAKRHFGVHGYFTKQSWNVVREYIRNFSRKGDVVLDPFGGSGVTIIEAAALDRVGIHVDINPLANFLTDAILHPVNVSDLNKAVDRFLDRIKKNLPKTKAAINREAEDASTLLQIPLSKDADVGSVSELFSDLQKAQLNIIRKSALKEKNEGLRKCLLLILSSTITKFNLTYHPSKSRGATGGDSAAFRYYRYRVAPNPTELDLISYLKTRIKRVTAAKIEIASLVNKDAYKKQQVIQGSATDLSMIKNDSVDYIYTDPPYGSKIAYLDLSAMWLAWLNIPATDDDFQLEAIQGGSLEKSKDDYNELIRSSIFEMYRVLKFDRWLSFVFAHKDPEFWHLILESAEAAGFEYVGATPQKNGASSFKKRQHPFTVLSGQLIISFRKTKNPKAIMQANLGMDFTDVILETIEAVIARNDGATIEEINDELIIRGLELGFLDLLKKEYSDLTPILMENFEYDEDSENFFILPEQKFRTHVDEKLRIRYFLLSYLRRKSKTGKSATFDEIVLEIMPLLKNGITPENQTILSVLEKIAIQVGENSWVLGETDQADLFND